MCWTYTDVNLQLTELKTCSRRPSHILNLLTLYHKWCITIILEWSFYAYSQIFQYLHVAIVHIYRLPLSQLLAFIIADWPHTLSALRSQQRGCVGSLIINTGIVMHFKKIFSCSFGSQASYFIVHHAQPASWILSCLFLFAFLQGQRCTYTKANTTSRRRAASVNVIFDSDCGVTCLHSLCTGYSQIWSADSLRLKIILPRSRDIHMSCNKANLFHPLSSFLQIACFWLCGCSISCWLAYKLSCLKVEMTSHIYGQLNPKV